MRADEEEAFFVGRSGTAGAAVVALRRRQGQGGEEVGIPIGIALRYSRV